MIPQHAYRSFIIDKNDRNCECGMCVPIGSDWSDLSNTERMAKMIILKAQIAAKANENKTKL